MRVLLVTLVFTIVVEALKPLVFQEAPGEALAIVPKSLGLGSCCDQDSSRDMTLWQSVLRRDPDAWVWMGDNIYPDEGLIEDPKAEEKNKKECYAKQAAKTGYSELSKQVAVLGTWDDHDYAGDDKGADYPNKEMSQRVFLDFLKEPSDSARRKQKGVYSSYLMGAGGSRVKIVLLDCRTFKDEASLLGPAQWEWLRRELVEKEDGQQLNVLVSSIQVLNNNSFNAEKWGDWPDERARLYSMLNDVSTAQTVIFSGDRHMGEVARDCSVQKRSGGVVEVTTSGLTKTRPAQWTVLDCNEYRVSGVMSDMNFGTIDFDWLGQKFTVAIRDENGKAVTALSISLSTDSQYCVTGTRSPKLCGLSGLVAVVFIFLLSLLLLPFSLFLCWRAPGLFGARPVSSEDLKEDAVWRGIDHFKSYVLWASGSSRGGAYRRVCDSGKDDDDPSL